MRGLEPVVGDFCAEFLGNLRKSNRRVAAHFFRAAEPQPPGATRPDRGSVAWLPPPPILLPRGEEVKEALRDLSSPPPRGPEAADCATQSGRSAPGGRRSG